MDLLSWFSGPHACGSVTLLGSQGLLPEVLFPVSAVKKPSLVNCKFVEALHSEIFVDIIRFVTSLASQRSTFEPRALLDNKAS